jgi:hypothetical protein
MSFVANRRFAKSLQSGESIFRVLFLHLTSMRVLFLCLLLLAPFVGKAQAVPDTLVQQPLSDSMRDALRARDTASGRLIRTAETVPANNPTLSKTFTPFPKKAALYSAMLPGGGQIYNKQWWKVPVIYAGVATSFYFLIDNTNQYRKYRTAYLASLNPLGSDEPLLLQYDQQQLKTLQDAYRQYLDLTTLFTAVGYTIQVLDALVFAHLKNFDVSQDLSLRMKPVVMPAGGVGLGLVMGF